MRVSAAELAFEAGDLLATLEKTEFQAYYESAVAKAAAAEARWNVLWKYRADEVKQAEADLERRIVEDAHRVLTHFAGATGVISGLPHPRERIDDSIIALHSGTWPGLLIEKGFQDWLRK